MKCPTCGKEAGKTNIGTPKTYCNNKCRIKQGVFGRTLGYIPKEGVKNDGKK